MSMRKQKSFVGDEFDFSLFVRAFLTLGFKDVMRQKSFFDLYHMS